MHRNFVSTAKSFDRFRKLKNRVCKPYTIESLAQELEENYNEAIKNIEKEQIPYALIPYPQVCKDFGLLKRRFKKLGIRLPSKAEEVWNNHVDL